MHEEEGLAINKRGRFEEEKKKIDIFLQLFK